MTRQFATGRNLKLSQLERDSNTLAIGETVTLMLLPALDLLSNPKTARRGSDKLESDELGN